MTLYYTLFHTLQVCTLENGTIRWIPPITFSFMTWQGVDVKRVQLPVRLCFAVTTVHRATVTRARRWTGSFFIYEGMFSCTEASMSAIYKKSSEIRRHYSRMLTTEDRACPYTLFAKAVSVVYFSSIPELLDLTLLCLYILLPLPILLSSCCPCIYHGAGFSSFGGYCSFIIYQGNFLPFLVFTTRVNLFPFFPFRNIFHAGSHDVATLL